MKSLLPKNPLAAAGIGALVGVGIVGYKMWSRYKSGDVTGGQVAAAALKQGVLFGGVAAASTLAGGQGGGGVSLAALSLLGIGGQGGQGQGQGQGQGNFLSNLIGQALQDDPDPAASESKPSLLSESSSPPR